MTTPSIDSSTHNSRSFALTSINDNNQSGLSTSSADSNITPIIDLNSSIAPVSGFILNGIDIDDFSGGSVSGAGDVNGDGFDDIIIGARRADPNDRRSSGESYVVFGSSDSFDRAINLSDLNGNNGFVLNGVDNFGNSGSSVRGAGDVNGDGFDDIIIGAPSANPNSSGNRSAGESYVVFGTSKGFDRALDLSRLNGNNGFVLNGIDSYDGSGRSVSGAGDVNGDGFDDIIIGANGADANGNFNAGESYVVFGTSERFDRAINLSDLNGDNGFVLNGIGEFDNAGISVSSAGDVNGDGFDDIIIGSLRTEYSNNADPNSVRSSGENYVVFGTSNGFDRTIDLRRLNGRSGFSLEGSDTRLFTTRSVGDAGDVNGDGFDDIIIGSENTDSNGNFNAGASYVVFGASDGFDRTIDLRQLNGSDGFVLNGINSFDRAGNSVSGAGDVNGDGFDDIIIGASVADANGSPYSGASYVVFGTSDSFGSALDLSSLDGSNGFVLNGSDRFDRAGNSVSGAGDVNGDGFDDIIIGASNANTNGNFTGESYVILGGVNLGSGGSINLADISGTDISSFLGTDFAVVYSGNPTSIVSNSLSVDAGDADILTGATVVITNPLIDGSESLLVDTTGTTLTANFDVSTGTLALSGTDTVENYVQALRTVQYTNEIATADTAERIIEFTIESGSAFNNTSAAATSTVTFNNVATSGDDFLLGTLNVDDLNGLAGNDTINGFAGEDLLMGDRGDDFLNGGEGEDDLMGGDGDDSLSGNAGEDWLMGGAGNDFLRGQGRRDTLVGVADDAVAPGLGERDRLIGGDGADTFLLGNETSAFYIGTGSALIKDFSAADGDVIQLSGSSSDYELRTSASGTRIFLEDGGASDLVGLVRDVTLTDFSSGFSFV